MGLLFGSALLGVLGVGVAALVTESRSALGLGSIILVLGFVEVGIMNCILKLLIVQSKSKQKKKNQ